MVKKILLCFVASLFLFPALVFAKEDDFVILSENTKYYKTETYSEGINKNKSITYEITKEEYDSVNVEEMLRSNPTTVNTTYKSMTSSISANGNYYRYKNVLNWKTMPSTRSYDIIGIGFLQSVKVHSNTTYFEQYYCYTGGSCYYSYSNTPQIFVSGAGTSFKLPSGNLNTLRQTFYFDVEKNTNNTIYSQYAYGDYSHATSTVSQSDATNYSVIQSGAIYLDSSIASYYDSIPTATASWSGSW